MDLWIWLPMQPTLGISFEDGGGRPHKAVLCLRQNSSLSATGLRPGWIYWLMVGPFSNILEELLPCSFIQPMMCDTPTGLWSS
eukprot:6867514-Karenia_brevis.AAC.1